MILGDPHFPQRFSKRSVPSEARQVRHSDVGVTVIKRLRHPKAKQCFEHHPSLQILEKINKKLISNVLSYPGLTDDFKRFVESTIDQKLDPEILIEIGLLKDLKLRRFSMEAINNLANQSEVSSLH